jgi:pimeloyl-ACP methyl ester carboxylesterase
VTPREDWQNPVRVKAKGSVVLVTIALLGVCCTHSGGGGSPVSRTTPAASATAPAAPAPDTGALPTILLHGFTGGPEDLYPLCDLLGTGRTVIRQLHVQEADALAPSSLPPDVIVNFDYYKESRSSPKYDPDPSGNSHGSIGGCPIPRNDGLDSYYTTSYAERVARCVEDVKRATGRDRVNIAAHSMGGLVARACTRWLATRGGQSSVARIFLIASPGRGLNALETIGSAILRTGPLRFMQMGEVLEMCSESDDWGGTSWVGALDDGWDTFCSVSGIRYAGVSGLGTPGPGAPLVPGGGVASFYQGILSLTPAQIGGLAPLLPKAVGSFSSELAEILAPSDGTVPLASTRLDQPPFLGADLWGVYHGSHIDDSDPEGGVAGATWTAECVRAYCLESSFPPTGARCTSVTLTPVDSPGRATWLRADVSIVGTRAIAAQLVEETLDATGNVTSTTAYAQPLGAGDQTLGFMVPRGGGKRSYELYVYGDHGPIGVVPSVVVSLQDGPVETAPRATVAATVTGNHVHVVLGSNASPNDPARAFSERFDFGAWSPFAATTELDTPPLAPGHHRLEAVARSSSNAAGVTLDGLVPAAIDMIVDASGAIHLIP